MSERLSPKEMLSRLVAFDTTSHKSNLPITAFIKDYLASHGVASQRVVSEDGEKANLYATIGPQKGSGIALSGHMDVVPVTGQNWSSNPFVLCEASDKLYGRGACDMKGFLACVLAAVPDFAARELAIPIHLAFSHDEEVGCLGVRSMIAKLGESLPKPAIVIVGEPTGMTVVDAHKGIHAFVTDVTGRAAHNSMPHLGVNAIDVAAQFISELERIAVDLRQRDDGPRFDPPHTTLTVSNIDGGEAVNIVPKNCRIIWQFRNVPATDAEEIPRRMAEFAQTRLMPAMQTVEADARIETRKVNEVPDFHADGRSEAVSLALKLTQRNELNAVSYGTEAGLFELAGSSTVVCGPGFVDQAHTADEFVDVTQLQECSAFLDRLAQYAAKD